MWVALNRAGEPVSRSTRRRPDPRPSRLHRPRTAGGIAPDQEAQSRGARLTRVTRIAVFDLRRPLCAGCADALLPFARPRCARLRCSGVSAVVLAVGAVAAAPGVAGAQQCPDPNQPDPGYLDTCGPQFVLPAWGDAGGWTDPSQYSTIQLADVNGDGTEELLARGDNGVQIHYFDTSLGQWRPQVDATGIQQVLTTSALRFRPRRTARTGISRSTTRRSRPRTSTTNRARSPRALGGRDARLQVHPAGRRARHRRRLMGAGRDQGAVQRR